MQPRLLGKEPIWDGHSSIHNAMMDSEGRVWFSAGSGRLPTRISARRAPIILAQVAPQETSARQVSVYDPKTGKCSTSTPVLHTHLYFRQGRQPDAVADAGGPGERVVGWVNTKLFLETATRRNPRVDTDHRDTTATAGGRGRHR